MYTDFSELLPDVMQILYREGVDEETFNKNRALYAIRAAYIELVKRSHAIRRTYVIPAQAHVNDYRLFKKEGYVINKIYSVTVDCHCYNPGKFCSCNCCKYTYNYQDGALNICPATDCDGKFIEVCASVFPDRKQCVIEDRILELYGSEIASGAAHNLLSKATSGPYQVEFDAGVERAASEAAKSWSKSPVNKQRSRWVRR